MVTIHDQARGEAEKRWSPDTDSRRWGTALGFIPAEKREAYVAGFLAGHEAATRTRVVDHERIIALLDGIDRTQDDGGWWETSTGAEHGAATLAAIRAGSVDTHTDTPGEDTRG